MHPLRRVAALLLLTLWVPALLHCRLEAAGLRFAADCCETSAAKPHAPTPVEGCADDSCDVAEGEFTAPSSLALHAPAPILFLSLLDGAPLSLSPVVVSPPETCLSPEAAAPPEVRRSWHFVTRAAPPPRAPPPIA